MVLQTASRVGKIVLGLAQVLSKQPDVLRSKELIEQFQDHPWLQIVAFDFEWIVPVCQVDYVQTFLLNTLALPVCLMSFVVAIWASAPKLKANRDGQTSRDEAEAGRERTMMWRSDMYFALFLTCKSQSHSFRPCCSRDPTDCCCPVVGQIPR